MTKRKGGSRGRVTLALVALIALVLIGWGVKSCSASQDEDVAVSGAPAAQIMSGTSPDNPTFVTIE